MLEVERCIACHGLRTSPRDRLCRTCYRVAKDIGALDDQDAFRAFIRARPKVQVTAAELAAARNVQQTCKACDTPTGEYLCPECYGIAKKKQITRDRVALQAFIRDRRASLQRTG